MGSLVIIDSQLVFCMGGLELEVGDERGGVTGALLEIRRGGRDEGMALRRKANMLDCVVASRREGLGKEDDEGLGWYEGIGLAK